MYTQTQGVLAEGEKEGEGGEREGRKVQKGREAWGVGGGREKAAGNQSTIVP